MRLLLALAVAASLIAGSASATDYKILRYLKGAQPTVVEPPARPSRPVEFVRIVIHPPGWGGLGARLFLDRR